MQFRLIWSFLFISENSLTPRNTLYKTLFWKQFNSSESLSMNIIKIRKALCHAHVVTPVILWLRCSQMGIGLLLLLVKKIFFWKEKTYQASPQSLRRTMNYPVAPASPLWLHFALNIYSVGFSEEWEEAQRLQEWMYYMHKQPHANLSCSG